MGKEKEITPDDELALFRVSLCRLCRVPKSDASSAFSSNISFHSM